MCLLTISCHSGEDKKPAAARPAEKIYEPGIVLTFDDDYIEDWYNADKLLHPQGWKATFFICKYSSFTPQQKQQLHYLQDRGHDIAGHGYNHLNAVKYTANHSLKEYVADEILPLKEAMAKDGFTLRSFAYPDGAHDPALDNQLYNYFDMIRGHYLRQTSAGRAVLLLYRKQAYLWAWY